MLDLACCSYLSIGCYRRSNRASGRSLGPTLRATPSIQLQLFRSSLKSLLSAFCSIAHVSEGHVLHLHLHTLLRGVQIDADDIENLMCAGGARVGAFSTLRGWRI